MPPLFSGAVNLKHFSLSTEDPPYLGHFTFPNLTTFELYTSTGGEAFLLTTTRLPRSYTHAAGCLHGDSTRNILSRCSAGESRYPTQR
jgi:hypothetical protein